MKLNTADLLKAFNRVAHLAKGRTTMAILSCVKLDSEGVDELEIVGSNMDVWKSAKVPCTDGIIGCCVNAMAFGGFLGQCTTDDVTLTWKQGRLTIAGSGTAVLPTLAVEEFPAWPADKAKTVALPPVDLADLMDNVKWAAGDVKNNTDINKTVVWVKSAAKVIEACAFPGAMCAYGKRALICGDSEWKLPGEWVGELTETLREPNATLSLAENYAHASSELGNVAVRLVDGKWFSIDEMHAIIANPENLKIDVDPPDFLRPLNTALMLSNGEPFTTITLDLRKGEFRLLGKLDGISYDAPLPVKAD